MIRILQKRGLDHKLNCEDSFFFKEEEKYCFLAVFDGCSGGYRSYFASELLSKIFKDVIENIHFKNNIETMPLEIYELMRRKLRLFKFILPLVEIKELESTCIFSIINKKENKGVAVFIGDGVIVLDGKVIINDQDDKPDYIAHNIGEDFEDYGAVEKDFIIHCRVVEIPEFKDISLCTDGILTYSKFVNNNPINNEEVTKEVINSLCIDKFLMGSEAMLGRKHFILEKENFFHKDDLTIVRYISENENETI